MCLCSVCLYFCRCFSVSSSPGILLQILQRIDLTFFGRLRKDSEYTSLLKSLKTILVTHSDPFVLEEVCETYRYLTETEYPEREQAESQLNEVVTSIANEFNKVYDSIHGSQIDMETTTAERLFSLQRVLRRIQCLINSMNINMLHYDHTAENSSGVSIGAKLQKSMDYYIGQHDEPGEEQILISLLYIAYRSLQWNMVTLNEELGGAAGGEEEDAAMEDVDEGATKKTRGGKKGKRASKGGVSKAITKLSESTHKYLDPFLEQLVRLFSHHAHILVRDVAYKILSDLFVLCNGQLKGTELESFMIQGETFEKLSLAYLQHFRSLTENEDQNERLQATNKSMKDQNIGIGSTLSGTHGIIPPLSHMDKESFRKEQIVTAFRLAAHVCCYDTNNEGSRNGLGTTLRHEDLAGLLFSRLGQVSETEREQEDGLHK